MTEDASEDFDLKTIVTCTKVSVRCDFEPQNFIRIEFRHQLL